MRGGVCAGHHRVKESDMADWSPTWTFYEGVWHEGNVLLWGARTHAIWLGSSVFDGARVFEGVAPDVELIVRV